MMRPPTRGSALGLRIGRGRILRDPLRAYGWLGVLGVAIATWWLLAAGGALPARLFPSPPRLVETMIDLSSSGELWSHIAVTVNELMIATGLFVVVGAMLGLALGSSRWLFDLTYGPISTLFAMPKITVLPIFVLAFGLGLEQKVLFGALYGFFPLVMNTMLGARGVRPIHAQLFDSFGARPLFRAMRLVLPSMLPFFVSGLRIGFVYAGIGVLLAEMYVSASGLGRKIVSSAEHNTLDEFWVYVCAASTILVAGAVALHYLEIRFSRWKMSS